MLTDTDVILTALMTVCFCSILLMTVLVLRALARLRNDMQAALQGQQLFLYDLERQIIDVAGVVKQIQPASGQSDDSDSNSALPLLRPSDPLQSLLEAAMQNGEQAQRLGESVKQTAEAGIASQIEHAPEATQQNQKPQSTVYGGSAQDPQTKDAKST